jgi:MFS family permease
LAPGWGISAAMSAPTLLPTAPELTHLAQIIQLAVAPVFLLAGLGAFLNVCAGRLARIVDRMRKLEPRILDSRGEEHDRLLMEVHLLDRRSRIVSGAIFMTVLSALLISAVVILLFLAFLTGYRFGTAIALLFIASMICTGFGFAIFLHETRLGIRAIQVRAHILEHQAEED